MDLGDGGFFELKSRWLLPGSHHPEQESGCGRGDELLHAAYDTRLQNRRVRCVR
jgi:hypothetical protein